MASSSNQLNDSLTFSFSKSSSSDSFICDATNTPSSSGAGFPQKLIFPNFNSSIPEKTNNSVTNKNSLVITNSRLASKVNQNQVLSGISFKDE